MSTEDSDDDFEGRGGELSTGDPDDDCEGQGRGGELSRSICDERRRGETAICSLCDERWATASRRRRRASLATATATIGFLIFSVLVQSLYWGFFFVFFGTESVLSLVYCFCFFLVCFDFVLIVIFRLSQYLRDWFSLWSLQRHDRGTVGKFHLWFSVGFFFFFLRIRGWVGLLCWACRGWVCSAGLAVGGFALLGLHSQIFFFFFQILVQFYFVLFFFFFCLRVEQINFFLMLGCS